MVTHSLIRSAIYNVLRGGTSAFIALLLPPILARLLSADSYGTWVLVLQVSAYVNFFDLGVQTAVGRYIAHTNEVQDSVARDRVVGTALIMLIGAAILGFLVTLASVWSMPILFRGIPSNLIYDFQVALFVTGGILAIGLVFSLFSGISIGFQRYDIPAVTIGGGKLLGACLVVFFAWFRGSILVMSIGLAIANLLSYFAQWLYTKRIFPEIKISLKNFHLSTLKELTGYCFSLTIWSLATLLITGLDTTIIGIFEFDAVAYYAVAASIITFITGMQYAMFTALIPTAASVNARNQSDTLGSLLLSSTRYGMLILLATALPLVSFADQLLGIWVGTDYATNTVLLLKILLIGNVIRLSALPYALLLVGSGQQRRVIISPIFEGVSNLLFSLILGYRMGAIGVALGTLIGGFVGVLSNIFYNMPRTPLISVNRLQYMQTGILLPIVCFTPAILVALIGQFYSISWSLTLILWSIAFASSCFMIWIYCIDYQERIRLILLIEKHLLRRSRVII